MKKEGTSEGINYGVGVEDKDKPRTFATLDGKDCAHDCRIKSKTSGVNMKKQANIEQR